MPHSAPEMQKFRWTSTIWANLVVLRCVGLWPKGDETYKCNFYTFYSVTNAILIIGGHNLFQFLNMFVVYSDLEALVGTIFIMITNILATVKMLSYGCNLKLVKDLLAMLEHDVKFQPRSNQQLELVQPTLRFWKRSYLCFTVLVATNVLLWVIAPLWNKDPHLPFPAWYPFESDSSPGYQLVYVYQAICIFYITAANLNLDTVTYALMMFIKAQCDILCDNLNGLTEDNFAEDLVECIEHHKDIIRFAKTCNNVVNMIILGQFATSTLVLALTMFQLSLVNPLGDVAATLTNLFYLSGIATEIFLYCWFGNEIELKSAQIFYALYSSDWFSQSAKTKRIMCVFGERCQKPIRITAVKLFTLSLSTFIAILRGAWSYFAVLYNVNST